MKKPHHERVGAEKLSPAADDRTISDNGFCPYSLNCNKWTHDYESETASCAFCYQVFSRADLARILAGRA